MLQLRRKLAELWNSAHQEEENDSGHARAAAVPQSTPTASAADSHGEDTQRRCDPAASAVGTASGAGSAIREQSTDDDTDRKNEGEERDHVARRQERSLLHPWGTSDASPPLGWSSGSSRDPLQSLYNSNHSNSSSVTESSADSPVASSTILVVASVGGASAEPADCIDRDRRGSTAVKRQREVLRLSYGHYNSSGSSNGRKRNGEDTFTSSLDEMTYNRSVSSPDGDADLQEQLQLRQAPSRRRRTCPADSTFVTPVQVTTSHKQQKRSSPLNHAGAAATVDTQAEQEEEEELELLQQRASPASHLIFRAGFMKALLGGRAAAKRAKTATKIRRRTKELHAMLIRRAFYAAHPPPPEGVWEAVTEGGESTDEGEGLYTSNQKGKLIEAEEEIRRRVNRSEEEQDHTAEERAASRLRRLENLRAEALAAFEDAREAQARLVSSGSAALSAEAGPDMVTLRKLFGGPASASARFKEDADVERMRRQYTELERVLQSLKGAQKAGDLNQMEGLLASKTASSLKRQPEFVSAAEALRVGKEREAEDEAKKTAEKSRIEAATAAAKVKEAAVKAAAAVAAVAAQSPEIRSDPVEQQQEQPGGSFLEDVDRLKAIVEARRSSNEDILASVDPGVKRTRMAFKKSYQGCLNKLSSTPSAVSKVVSDIHGKAEAPLGEARRAGWENKAREFLYFNLADKLVDYSERDHFSAESYRMAFPLACVAVDLMAAHGGLSDLFLGTLYSRCPSAVPALSFNTAGKSDNEVMTLFGKLEEEDIPTFLNRTKGLIVFMATVMQTPASARAGKFAHPLPLAEGWRWLARFVNGLAAYVKQGNPPPLPTGPVLEWFFKVVGFELQRRYGRAMDKVVQIVKTEVLPTLLPKSMVPHLLDVVIEDYEGRGGRFVPPAGRGAEFQRFRTWGDT